MNSQLILAPKTFGAKPYSQANFVATLVKIGFVGKKYKQDAYLIGTEFQQLLIFMGCSPQILSEPDKPNFLRITIPVPTDAPQFYFGKQTKTPLCLNCKQALSNWRDQHDIVCTNCAASFLPQDLNWRRSACISCAPIKISPIFDGEAMPSDSLMQHLKVASGGADYAYAYV